MSACYNCPYCYSGASVCIDASGDYRCSICNSAWAATSNKRGRLEPDWSQEEDEMLYAKGMADAPANA